MDGADAVGLPGQAQGQDRHAERLVLGVGPGTAQFEQFVEINAAVTHVFAEIFLHQLRVEGVVARRHRRVRGEDAAGGDRLQGLDEGKFFPGHQHPDPLQPQECRVPLVHVKNRRLDAHRVECPHPTDAQHDLLPHPHVVVAPVQLVGDVPVILRIGPKIGVEEEQAGQADPHFPNLRLHFSPGHVQLDHHGSFPVGGQGLADRQILENVVDDARLLPAVLVDALGEISEAVEQADRHERQAEVAGRFAVVARQDAETPRVDRQGLVETKLGGKISHQGLLFFLLGKILGKPGGLAVEVGLQFFVNFFHPFPERFVFGRRLQAGLLDQPKHFDGAMTALLP